MTLGVELYEVHYKNGDTYESPRDGMKLFNKHVAEGIAAFIDGTIHRNV